MMDSIIEISKNDESSIQKLVITKLNNAQRNKFVWIFSFFYKCLWRKKHYFSMREFLKETKFCVNRSCYYYHIDWFIQNKLLIRDEALDYVMTDLFIKILNRNETKNKFMEKWNNSK